jgi:hypothetical protein
MLQLQALVDYEKFRAAKVVIFLEASSATRAFDLLAQHGGAIEKLAAGFGARVYLVEEKRLQLEALVEEEFADAWLLLVSDGQSRSMTTKKYPQRINLDSKGNWEACAFKEVLRQVRETTRIIEDVTGYYSRFSLRSPAPKTVALQSSAN